MKVVIIGSGFAGLVSAAAFASTGNQVIGLDIDKAKVESLNQGFVPFHEPKLESLIKEGLDNGSLEFTSDYSKAIPNAEIVIVVVGTPSASDGQADLKYVLASSESMAPYLSDGAIVVIKSTVPPGTLEKVEAVITPLTDVSFHTASLPEFLKEGSAVDDTLHPDRVVIGATEPEVFEKLEQLHKPFNAPVIKISPESAQMSKYAANAYLATRITFINHIADLCQHNGADVDEVIKALGQDKRIGSHYWYPGLGYGGSCFPKDVKELAAYSRSIGLNGNFFNKVNELNNDRIPLILSDWQKLVGSWQDKTIAILGLSFKPNTDDTRESPASHLVPNLLRQGAKIKSYDPMTKWSPDDVEHEANYSQVASIEEACQNAEIIMALIEWPEIIQFDFSKLGMNDRNRWFFDARNQFDRKTLENAGFTYQGIGK